MQLERKILLTFILLGLFLCKGYAQTESISGIINHYASVTSILQAEINDNDSLVVSGMPIEFKDGDTVMLYIVRGADIRLEESGPGKDDIGDIGDPYFTGKYAFLIINEIIKGPVDTIVVLNAGLYDEIQPLEHGEVAQLIRVPSYRRAIVTGEVTAPPWNGSTGGVVSMFVTTKLTLNADINVTGKGFRGANWDAVDAVYEGACSSTDPDLYDSLFYQMNPVLAGKKGESVTYPLFESLRGKGSNINGGGGGNGKLSGGGGGGNYNPGGQGGEESEECIPIINDQGGLGGVGLQGSWYENKDEISPIPENRYNRIFFGGGGGAGVNVSGLSSSAGANGGGVVVIVADTIDGNGTGRILADGASVSGAVEGAGGGGGGGGAIILDVSAYENTPELSAIGGKGGDTNGGNRTGPGGGGGGGIYWFAEGPQGLDPKNVQGLSGRHTPSSTDPTYGAQVGGNPGGKGDLDAPLRGFLFNTVPTEFKVCSDQVPETIFASKPKGGSGTYTYQWVDSSSTQNQWLNIPGATGQDLTFSSPLSDTTYFRRIVTDPAVIEPDISFRIAVYVHQAITNNMVAAPDTVCLGAFPEPFVSVGLPGNGDGTYKYLWEQDEGSGSYLPAEGINDETGYETPAGLLLTTHFRRVTTSGACVDNSAPLTVTVFASITGNTIKDKDTICWNTAPDLITQDPEISLGGGDPDPTNWRYRWESGPAGAGPWSEISGATSANYQPGELTATAWYRREVLSGNDNACRDTSEAVEILNVPVITGNEILTDDQTVCTDDQPALVQGSGPGGGHLDLYNYLWESRTASTPWGSADNTNGNDQQSYTPPVLTGDTTIYRRVVLSGGVEGVCKDTSESKTINVLPAIVNNDILTEVTVNCQFDLLADLIQNPDSGSEPGGGATQGGNDPTRNYRWEKSSGDAPDTWDEVSYGPSELNFTDNSELSDTADYWYRRVVLSGPNLGGQDQVCSDPSDTIHIVIHTAISNNLIDVADSVCFNTEKVLNGEIPLGDPEESTFYSWRDVDSGSELGIEENLPFTFTTLDDRQLNRIVVIGECEDTSNLMPITIMELPGGILSGDLPKACEKDVLLDVNLNMEDLTNYVIPWEISLDDGVNPEFLDAQFLDADGTVTVTLSIDSTDEISTQYDYTIGQIVYRLTDGTECLADEATGTIDGNVPIEVFLTPEPKITVTTEPANDTVSVCDNEISLVVDPDNGIGSWGSDNPDKLGFLPDAQTLSVRASLDPTDQQAWGHLPYVIYFRSEAGDCSDSDTVWISFFEQPEDAEPGPSDTIYLTTSVRLNANPATAGVGTWTLGNEGSGEFENVNDPKTDVTGLTKGRNKFTWTIENGVCNTSADFTVITQAEAQPYEGFSPNGDMVNDYFIIRGLGELKGEDTFSMSIFNSLGNTVRTINQDNVSEIAYNPGAIPGGLRDDEMVVWDGKSNNGNVVPAGTYYYVLNVTKFQEDGNMDTRKWKKYIVVSD